MGGDHEYGKAVHTPRHAWLHTKAVYPIIGLCGIACALSFTSIMKHLLASPHTSVNRNNMGQWFRKPQYTWPAGAAFAKPQSLVDNLPESE